MPKVLSLLFIFLPAAIWASPLQLFISNNNSYPVSFKETECIYIQQGDSTDYISPDYDDSEWEAVSFPFDWTKNYYPEYTGIVWFRIHVRFPETLPESVLGIDLGDIFDRDETYFNGYLIGGLGDLETEKGYAYEVPRIYSIPTQFIRPGEDNVFAIKVYSPSLWKGGFIDGDYLIGRFDQFIIGLFSREIIKIVFITVYFLVGFYFLLLFIKKPSEKQNLWFSLFTLFFGLYSMLRLDTRLYFIENFYLMKKMEYALVFIIPTVFTEYIFKYFHKKRNPLQIIAYIITIACSIVVLFTHDIEIWRSLNIHLVQIFWFLLFGLVIFALIKEYPRNRDARFMLYTCSVFFIIAIADILITRQVIIAHPLTKIGFLSTFGFAVFVLGLTIIHTNRIVRLFKTSEKMNARLEIMVEKRTSALNKLLSELKKQDEINQRELYMAGQIQKALLPDTDIQWKQLKVVNRYFPLRSVSGDFYDIFHLPGNRYGVMLADASGHGMPAAIYTILAKRSFLKASTFTASPAKLFKLVNNDLCDIISSHHYLTCFMVSFDDEMNMCYSTAGHPAGIFFNNDSNSLNHIQTEGMIVGCTDLANKTFKEKKLKFSPGSKLILYTDCLIESTDENEEPYGIGRLTNIVSLNAHYPVETVIDKILDDFRDYVKGKELRDDLAIIGIENNSQE